MIFGAEGVLFTNLHGPGKVMLQSLPFSRLASRILANARPAGGAGEGSMLRLVDDMFHGDNWSSRKTQKTKAVLWSREWGSSRKEEQFENRPPVFPTARFGPKPYGSAMLAEKTNRSSHSPLSAQKSAPLESVSQ